MEIKLKEAVISLHNQKSSELLVKPANLLYNAVEVDSFCTSENNWKFSTEMQLLKRDFYPERSLYYLCRKYNSTYGNTELMRGESKYSSLYPTFSINILGYNHFKSDQKAVRRFTLYDEENQQPFHSPGLFMS